MTRATALFGLAVVAIATAACGSSSGDAPIFATCGDDVRVGQFTLNLKPPVGDTPAYGRSLGWFATVSTPRTSGRDRPRWSCHASIGPVADCAPACAFGMVCRAGAARRRPPAIRLEP